MTARKDGSPRLAAGSVIIETRCSSETPKKQPGSAWEIGKGGPLRIALVSYRSKPHCGGQGVYVRHLSRELAALGHDVEVVSGPPYPELDDVPGVRLTRLRSLDLYREPDPFRVPHLREFRSPV